MVNIRTKLFDCPNSGIPYFLCVKPNLNQLISKPFGPVYRVLCLNNKKREVEQTTSHRRYNQISTHTTYPGSHYTYVQPYSNPLLSRNFLRKQLYCSDSVGSMRAPKHLNLVWVHRALQPHSLKDYPDWQS